ncbi:MAG: proline dehydrogenase, partial [Bacteroidetes bacterium RIFOXYB2_FULL_35_7]
MLNQIIVKILPYLPEKFVWIFSKKYVSGKTKEEALQVCKDLNAQGIKFTLDILGEFIKSLDEAEKNKKEYLDLIEYIQKFSLDGNFSLKPTMFGLLLNENICYNHIREIVQKAVSFNNFIRIDMEDSQCTDKEISLFLKLKKEFPYNVGLVLQAYLKRTKNDIEMMMDINNKNNPLNFRLCKGIYIEPEQISFKKYKEINDSYIINLDFMLRNNIYVAIATHDKTLVEYAYQLITKYNVPKNMYEFQMLFGVTLKLR